MSKKQKQVKKPYDQLFIYSAILLILFLTIFNINKHLSTKTVLGTSTTNEPQNTAALNERLFWEDFVEKNPSYIPGWIELGRMDKVREIDPNYELGN